MTPVDDPRSPRDFAIRSTFPVFWGYLVVGVSFGILLQRANYSLIHAAVSGLLVYAGSAQLLSLKLIENHESLFHIFLAVLVLNIRHFFYGMGIYHRYKRIPWKRRWYLIFGLTDETFALVSSCKAEFTAREEQQYLLWVTLFNQLYWIVACVVGTLVGSYVHFNLQALTFVLPALFIVLLVNYVMTHRQYRLPVLGALAGFIALFVNPNYILPLGLCIISVCVAGDLKLRGEK